MLIESICYKVITTDRHKKVLCGHTDIDTID